MSFVVAMAAVGWVTGRGVPGRGYVVVHTPREGVTPQAPSSGGPARCGPGRAALQAAGAQRVYQETLVGAAQRTLHPGGREVTSAGWHVWMINV